MPKFKFGKLVRDNILDDQLAMGAKPAYRTLSPAEHRQELLKKVAEEAAEAASATPDEIGGEIADIQQALDDLTELCGFTPRQIAKLQAARNAKAGAFKKGIFIEHVEVDADYAWVPYYRKHPDRYPEIE